MECIIDMRHFYDFFRKPYDFFTTFNDDDISFLCHVLRFLCIIEAILNVFRRGGGKLYLTPFYYQYMVIKVAYVMHILYKHGQNCCKKTEKKNVRILRNFIYLKFTCYISFHFFHKKGVLCVKIFIHHHS